MSKFTEDVLSSSPVAVADYPHWTVLFRPAEYTPELIPSLSDCVRVVVKSKVILRGWEFPYLAAKEEECQGRCQGSNWIGAWVRFLGQLEYWRLYQSGQFIFFAAVREVTENGWHEQLKHNAMNHLSHFNHDINWDSIPGFISYVNLVYTVTEHFEFAARICQAGPTLHRPPIFFATG